MAFDITSYILGKKSGGGGSSITVEALSVTENRTYTAPTGKAYSPVTVNVSGGSSDFTTATVAFVVNGSSATLYELFIIVGSVGNRYLRYNEEVPMTQSITVLMPLTDGEISFGISSAGTITTSGGATYYSEDEMIGVTGDCTITIS